MKKWFSLLLILTLAACAAPAVQPAAPQQPVVVAITVVAPEAPAAAAPATEVPPAAPAATEAPAATTVPTEAPTAAPEAVGTPTSLPAVGAPIFTDFARSSDTFSLKCSPSQITFGTTSINPYTKKVQIYYRMVDKLNSMASQWYAGPELKEISKDRYEVVFTALDVNPDVRYDNGWFEYQFVGLNKSGDVVGRTEKELFQQQVTFTKECP